MQAEATVGGALSFFPSRSIGICNFAPRSNRYSEAFRDPEQDPLVRVVHGLFSDGSCMWPPPTLFLTCFKWKGVWTAPMEAWFVSHWDRIHRQGFKARTLRSWADEWARPTKDFRQSANASRTVEDRAEVALLRARDSSIFEHTALERSGVLDMSSLAPN